jgi:hypothetical protein
MHTHMQVEHDDVEEMCPPMRHDYETVVLFADVR